MDRTAIYTRISEDPRLTGLGVERQLEDCRAFCEARGWPVVYELSDNDISAYTGKPRPGYRQLLDAIRDGEIERVVAWHTDRLHRRLRELVEYCDVVTTANVTTHTVKAGDIDLSTPSGIMIAQIKGAVDEAYVSESRLKNIRARTQIAERGGRHKSARVYGWNTDDTVRESEAEVIREIVKRLTSGETPTQVANDLNSRNIPTINGKRWTGIGARKCAMRWSNAAIREHRGELHYNGQWEPIISREDLETLRFVMSNRQRLQYKRGAGRKYLLTGFLFCQCGNKLTATVGSGKAKPAYRCQSRLSNDPRPQGCGKVSRQIEALEVFVSEAVLKRLDSDEMLITVSKQSSNQTAINELLRKRQSQQDRLDKLIDDYTLGNIELDLSQFNRAKRTAEDELDAITKQIAKLTSSQVLKLPELATTLTEGWNKASIDWRRNLLDLVIKRIVVHPLPKGHKVFWYKGFRFDPNLIEIEWRV